MWAKPGAGKEPSTARKQNFGRGGERGWRWELAPSGSPGGPGPSTGATMRLGKGEPVCWGREGGTQNHAQSVNEALESQTGTSAENIFPGMCGGSGGCVSHRDLGRGHKSPCRGCKGPGVGTSRKPVQGQGAWAEGEGQAAKLWAERAGRASLQGWPVVAATVDMAQGVTGTRRAWGAPAPQPSCRHSPVGPQGRPRDRVGRALGAAAFLEGVGLGCPEVAVWPPERFPALGCRPQGCRPVDKATQTGLTRLRKKVGAG